MKAYFWIYISTRGFLKMIDMWVTKLSGGRPVLGVRSTWHAKQQPMPEESWPAHLPIQGASSHGDTGLLSSNRDFCYCHCDPPCLISTSWGFSFFSLWTQTRTSDWLSRDTPSASDWLSILVLRLLDSQTEQPWFLRLCGLRKMVTVDCAYQSCKPV